MEGHGESLTEAFGLVVHGPRPDRVDVAPIGLRLRVHEGLAVNLTGGRLQEHRSLPPGQFQQVGDSPASGGQDLEGERPEVRRRGRARQVHDSLEGPWESQVRTDAPLDESHAAAVQQGLYVVSRARDQVVHAHDLVSPVEQAGAESGPDEAGSPGDQHSHHERPIPR